MALFDADYFMRGQELGISGYTDYPAHLMVLGPFFEAHTYVIEFDALVAATIVSRCKAFYDSLQAGVPPHLDDTVSSYQTVRELHPDITPDSVVEVDAELAVQVLQLDAALKDTERATRGHKSLLLDAMGNAQTAMCGDVKVADRRPHAKGGVALALATKNLNQLTTTEGETPA